MELTLSALPPQGASKPEAFRPRRAEITTFAAWQHALHGCTALQSEIKVTLPITVAPTASTRPLMTAAPAEAAAKLPERQDPEQPKPALNWERAVKLFVPPKQDDHTHVDETVWEDDFKAVAEWNAKPSRVEAFLARYDKNQTLTTLAFVALLLLWIY